MPWFIFRLHFQCELVLPKTWLSDMQIPSSFFSVASFLTLNDWTLYKFSMLLKFCSASNSPSGTRCTWIFRHSPYLVSILPKWSLYCKIVVWTWNIIPAMPHLKLMPFDWSTNKNWRFEPWLSIYIDTF